MAESGMWGTAVGGSEAAKEMLDAALGLSRIDLEGAHQRYYGAGAQKLELEAAEQKQLVELMQQQAAGVPEARATSLADQMDALARTAMNAGLVTKSQELAKNASLVRQREASAGSSATTAALNRLKIVREQAELTGQLFGGAKSPDDWSRANTLWEFQTGAPSPYESLPYDPALVERINSSAVSTKERIDAEEKRLSRQALAGFRGRRLEQHDLEREIREARLALARAREARLAKAGGGRGVSSPSTPETDRASSLIKRDYPDLPAADSQDAAFSVAAEARALRRANPALDANVALQQAYNNAKTAGDFQTLRRGLPILGWGGKQGFRGAGKTPETAAALPKDTATLQAGRYYLSPSGMLGKWNGKTFEIVTSRGRPLSPDNRRPADEEDEDEED